MSRIRYNKIEDFISGVKKARFAAIYFDVEYMPQQIRVPKTPVYNAEGKVTQPPDDIVTRMTASAKLTATDDKTFMSFVETIAQRDLLSQADAEAMKKEIDEHMDMVITKLQDEMPSIERKSGIIEPNPLG